jgi:hypothetical protein
VALVTTHDDAVDATATCCATLHHATRLKDPGLTAYVGAGTGQVEVKRLAVPLGWEFDVDGWLKAAADADLSSDTRLHVLSLFSGEALQSMGPGFYIKPSSPWTRCSYIKPSSPWARCAI